ncbi:MAG: hypothetical protein ACMVY4_15755 [Minwuia sp.]|uniref:hypothetical protein n=1 Tax=Minwuia sp. TaxID=2493630 RepID=UPI003A896FC0
MKPSGSACRLIAIFAACVLSACQTTGPGNSVQSPATAPTYGGIVDEGTTPLIAGQPSGEKFITGADYAATMRDLDPQLARAANLMVVTRGLKRSCSEEEIAESSGFGRFLDQADRLFARVFAQAFTMESRRLEAAGKPQRPAAIGLILSTTAMADTSDEIVGISRELEKKLGEEARLLSDADRLTLGCALLSRTSERRAITRRISTPLLEYFVMMKHGHPDIYNAIDNHEEILDGGRTLSQI